MSTASFVTLDSRKRLNLASFAPRESYKITAEKSGRIVLEPAVVLTEDELAVLSDTKTLALVEERLGGDVRVERRRRTR